jgi:hypothetical protein
MFRRSLCFLALLALLAAGCSSSTNESTTPPDRGVATSGFGGGTTDLAPLPYPGSSSNDGSALIVTSSLSLVVDEVETAIRSSRALVTDAGGVLVGISRGSDGGGVGYAADGSLLTVDEGPAFLTFRIPSDALEATIEALRPLGRLVGERTDASDVSGSLRDLGARLKNLRAAETNYQRLLDAATNVSDLLAVTAQLDSVRGQIEQLAAEQAALEDAVERSTLSVVLYPPAAPITDATDGFDLGSVVAQATGDLLGLGIILLSALVYLIVIGAPVALLAVGLYLLVGRRLIGRLRRRPRR